jgi:antitoxin (DNA-binding transcriptional repressor) of toxin-antitoxin stability system
MQTITLAEAQARLPELIDSLTTEKEIVITRGDQTIAVLLPKHAPDSAAVSSKPGQQNGGKNSQPSRPAGGVLGLKTYSVGKVLKPDFNREEVWDEMIAREE